MRCQPGDGQGGEAEPAELFGRGGQQRGVVARAFVRAAQAIHQQAQLLRGQAQALEQAGELALRRLALGVIAQQVAPVQACLHVGDLAREEGVGGVHAGVVELRHVFVGGQESGQARFLQRHGPGFCQVVGAAAASVFHQDETRPVKRTQQQPARLHARALGTFDLDGAPLLPQRGGGEPRHQGDGEHGREQRGTTLAQRGHGCRSLTTGLTQSRASGPATPAPGGSVISRRMPSGSAAPGSLAVLALSWPLLDWGLVQAPSR